MRKFYLLVNLVENQLPFKDNLQLSDYNSNKLPDQSIWRKLMQFWGVFYSPILLSAHIPLVKMALKQQNVFVGNILTSFLLCAKLSSAFSETLP